MDRPARRDRDNRRVTCIQYPSNLSLPSYCHVTYMIESASIDQHFERFGPKRSE